MTEPTIDRQFIKDDGSVDWFHLIHSQSFPHLLWINDVIAAELRGRYEVYVGVKARAEFAEEKICLKAPFCNDRLSHIAKK